MVKKRNESSDSDSDMKDDEAKVDRKKHNEMKLVTDTELLARFYGQDEELDHNEKFLRNYILNEGWKDKNGGAVNRQDRGFIDPREEVIPELKEKLVAVDDEDSQREDEMDKFECKYNFRFEDPNAATLTSHARNANEEETMRRKDSARKQARERAKDAKEDIKKQRKEEIAKLKALKKEEILEKLTKANHLA